MLRMIKMPKQTRRKPIREWWPSVCFHLIALFALQALVKG